MRKIFSKSLRARFFAGFLLVVLPPLIVTLIATSAVLRSFVEPFAVENLETISREVSADVRRALEWGLADLQQLAGNPAIKSRRASSDEKKRVMANFQALASIFEDVTLLDLKANVVASTEYGYRGVWKDKAWYLDAVRGRAVVSEAHAIVKPFKVVFSIAIPVSDEAGERRWVLVGQINMDMIWSMIDTVKIGKQGYVLLVSSRGRIVGSPHEDDILTYKVPEALVRAFSSGPYGSLALTGTGGEREAAAFTSINPNAMSTFPDWKAVAIQPTDEILGGVRQVQKITLAVFAVGALVCVLLGFRLAGYVTDPIKRLTEQVKEVGGSGDFGRRVPVDRSDEIGHLAEAFNGIFAKLKETSVSRDFIDGVINSIGASVLVIDSTGVIKSVNDRALEAFGGERETFVGKQVTSLFVGERSGEVELSLRPLLERGESVEFSAQCVGREGHCFPSEVIGTALRSEDGFSKDFVLNIRDISSLRRSEELARENLEQISKLNEFMVDREVRVVEMKKEVNALLSELGRPPKYS